MSKFGSKKEKVKKTRKKLSKELYRFLGTIWSNDISFQKDGNLVEKEIFNINVAEEKENSQYYKGYLAYFDAASNKWFRLKRINLLETTENSPDNAHFKLSINLEDDYQVEPLFDEE